MGNFKVINTKNRTIQDTFDINDDLTGFHPSELESDNIYSQLPMVWHKAKDFNIYDEHGNKWIDLTSGIFAMNAGHSNPVINQAIKNQLDADMVFSFLYSTKIRKTLAERLLEISPSHFEKVVLLNTGSEATDTAYKLIKYWAKANDRKYIVSFRGSYHGRVLSTDLMCGGEGNSNWSNVTDDDILFLDFPYDKETQFDPSALGDPSKIAAFVLETYQGWSAQCYPDKYMRDLYDFAKQNGCLVCFDEIQAGFYRMGEIYGYLTYGDYIKPDIVCLAKALGAPLPISAVLSTRELIDGAKKLGGTNAGNPLCCAAALANIEFLTNKDFQSDLKRKIKVFENRLKNLEKYDIINYINVRGMIGAIIFNNKEIANSVVVNSVRKGVMPVNTWSTSIKIGPPLTISIDAINEALDVIEECITKQNLS
jgi:acetylornithine/succinyldiaminopimelate/putrescine aminotransferase